MIDVAVPMGLLRRFGLFSGDNGGVILFIVGIVVSVCVLIVATVAIALDGVASVWAALASGFGHFVLRQPFLVEATTRTGRVDHTWVAGWRAARQVRREQQRAVLVQSEQAT